MHCVGWFRLIGGSEIASTQLPITAFCLFECGVIKTCLMCLMAVLH
jgi:hypothetical protein